MLEVIRMHREAMRGIKPDHVQAELYMGAQDAWDAALELARSMATRNSQVTVLAPTGTIGFMMDCDTTGIEPDLALVKMKKLVGGGVIKIVNNTVPEALMRLGYTPEQTSEIVSHIDKNGKIDGAPYLKEEHVRCSIARWRRPRWAFDRVDGHVKMMRRRNRSFRRDQQDDQYAEESTLEDIMKAYIESWKLG